MEIQSPVYVSDNVFFELGLMDLSDERKIALLEQMNDLIQKRVMLQLFDLLPDEAAPALEKAQAQGDEAVMTVLVEFVPNIAEVVLNEVEGVKADMMNIVSKEIV